MSFRFHQSNWNGRTLAKWLAGCTAATLVALPVVCALDWLAPHPVLAQGAEFNSGVAQYKAGKYQDALKSFSVALRRNPNSATTYYYIATCYHQLKDLKNAKQYYIEAISFGGLSAAGKSAIQGLSAIDPATAKGMADQLGYMHGTKAAPTARSASRPSGSSSSSVSSHGGAEPDARGELIAPHESRINFRRSETGGLFVEGSLNNKRMEMVYDTGASSCAFGKNHLEEAGIKPPSGPPQGYAMGAGDGGNQPIWYARVNLKVGQIERRNFPITVQGNLPTDPLLGQSFFNDFKYEIDAKANSIRLVRGDAPQNRGSVYASSSSSRDVPFRKEGNELIVDVIVNGRTIPMFFDTGADIVMFAPQHLAQIGLKIPEDAQDSSITGIAGSTAAKMFPVARMKLGPVEKQDVVVTAVQGHQNLPHPLLGQSFFGDWKFQIDNANNVIKFHSASGN